MCVCVRVCVMDTFCALVWITRFNCFLAYPASNRARKVCKAAQIPCILEKQLNLRIAPNRSAHTYWFFSFLALVIPLPAKSAWVQGIILFTTSLCVGTIKYPPQKVSSGITISFNNNEKSVDIPYRKAKLRRLSSRFGIYVLQQMKFMALVVNWISDYWGILFGNYDVVPVVPVKQCSAKFHLPDPNRASPESCWFSACSTM